MWPFAVNNCCMDMFLFLLLQVNQVQPSPASAFMQYIGEKGESSTLSSQSTSPSCRPSDWEELDSEATPFPLLAIYSETPLLMCFWWAALGEIPACLGGAQLCTGSPHERESVSQDTGFGFRQTGPSTWLSTWKVVQQNKYISLNLKHFHGISPDPPLGNC